MSELTKATPDAPSSTDVIFVHGLDGDGVATWTTSKQLANSWLTSLGAEVQGLAAWSLTYEIKALQWRGNTMPLPDRATNILELLISKGIGKRPLAFVCHSYGGLIVKQMLRSPLNRTMGVKKRSFKTHAGFCSLRLPMRAQRKPIGLSTLRRSCLRAPPQRNSKLTMRNSGIWHCDVATIQRNSG